MQLKADSLPGPAVHTENLDTGASGHNRMCKLNHDKDEQRREDED